MFIQIIFLVIGFIVLIQSANLFVDSASSLAKTFNVPKIIIGLTIVAFGTSIPEFAVSCKAILSGSGDIVLGNVVGSSIINILLILGACACIKNIKITENTYKIEIPIMILLTFASCILFKDSLFNNAGLDTLTRSDGIILVLFFGIFIWYLINNIKNNSKSIPKEGSKYGPALALIYIIIGVFGISVGASFIVDSASKIAAMLSISEKVIAITVIALGTALPEITTSLVAVQKNEHDLLLGNIIGSNIFNIGIVLGLPIALFGGITPRGFTYIDLLFYLVSSVIIFVFCLKNNNITKKEGIICICLFVLYYILAVI